jgi:hypothetical protein
MLFGMITAPTPVQGLMFRDWNLISALVAAARQRFGNPTAVPHDPPWSLVGPVPAPHHALSDEYPPAAGRIR